MPAAIPIAGAVIGAAGSAYSANKQSKAAKAAAQTQADAQTAASTPYSIFSPTGNTQVGYIGDDGKFASDGGKAINYTETDFQKAARERGESLYSGALNQYTSDVPLPVNPLSKRGLIPGASEYLVGLNGSRSTSSIESALPGLSMDFSGDSALARQSTYDLGAELLNPRFEQENRRREQRLADQGLPMGSEAYDDEMTRADKSQNDAYKSLALSSVLAGNQEQGRLFGQSMAGRQQIFGEQTALKQLEEAERAARIGEKDMVNDSFLKRQSILSGLEEDYRRNRLNEIAGILGRPQAGADDYSAPSRLGTLNPTAVPSSSSSGAWAQGLGQFGGSMLNMYNNGQFSGMFGGATPTNLTPTFNQSFTNQSTGSGLGGYY